ncbi:SGNH/GDSL hydrolase family protein [Tenacibaculum sp. 190524A05c]|uniref:SGNH/GDSL hydrolase family protein n=1 Tax=Tenacibaculum platacis TaxID=3137852 RepID=UPI0031FB3F6C
MLGRYFITLCVLISLTNTYAQHQKEYSILFIGNSLTYYNDLPKLVTEYAKNEKNLNIKTKMVAHPNYAIEDHWNDGKVKRLIRRKKYDYVILQQGPSSQKDGRKMLIQYGRKYSNLCKSSNTKLCYFMVWPAIYYYHTFNGVIKNHEDAAKLNNAILLPVGKVWKTHIEESKDYSLYNQDEFHPSEKGSKLAAKVIVETLFNLAE